MRIKDQTFELDDVELDNNSFEGCTFKNSRMIFRARGPVGFASCNFENPQWIFLDAAQLTVSFLAGLVNNGGDYGNALLINTFPTLKQWLKPEYLAKLSGPIQQSLPP